MMRVFLDTNVVLDLLGERHPFYTHAAQIATLVDKKQLAIEVSSLSFATVHYFLAKYENAIKAKEKLRKFKVLTNVSAVNEDTVEKALNADFRDFEDGLQYFSATDSGSEIIITRNAKDFKKSQIPVMTPLEFLGFWQKQNKDT